MSCSTFDAIYVELENQVQRLMEAHLALTQPTQVNKVTTSYKIRSGPYDTQYCMEDPEQAFVEYASRADSKPFDTLAGLGSYVNIIPFYVFKKLNIGLLEETNHIFGLANGTKSYPVGIVKDVEVHIGKLKLLNDFYVNDMKKDPETPLLVGRGCLVPPTLKLNPRENANGGVSNFTGRIKGMHVFVGNFTYIVDFMIIEDISSIIDPRLSQVVLGKPFVEISNMTHDPPEGVVRFTNGNNEVAYKMPHKIEQYDSLSDLEKEHTKSVYLRNEEDKRRGVEYVMSKILGFYKECLELGPEYLTGMDDEGKAT
ncbi:retrotransposon ORF1 [Tanacetum coccineum]